MSPDQIQKDVMKLVEFGVASTLIVSQAVLVTLAVFLFW